MLINFSKEITTLEGQVIQKQDVNGKNEGRMELKDICIPSLLAIYGDEPKLKAEVKVERFTLAQKIIKGGEIELTPEQIVMIKVVVGKKFGPLFVGQAYALLG